MRRILASGALVCLVCASFMACDGNDEPEDVATDQGQPDTGKDVPPDVPEPVDCCLGDDGSDPDPGPQCTCGDRVCGKDSCGQDVCGTCGENLGCSMAGKCEPFDGPDTVYGPSGRVSVLQTPPDATAAGSVCVDYTGDGKGDSSLANLAGQINGPLNDMMNDPEGMGILFEFKGAEDFADATGIVLNGLLGERIDPLNADEWYVTRDSFDPVTGKPLIAFPGTTITAGALAAGPSKFSLTIPIEDVPLTLTLNLTTIRGAVDADSTVAGGVSVKSGVLSGILSKAEVDKVIADLKATCAAAPAEEKPSYCQYLTVVDSAKALLFTLHDEGEGADPRFVPKSKEKPGDAAAACFTYELSKATKLELKPEAPPAQ